MRIEWDTLSESLDKQLTSLGTLQRGYTSLKGSLEKLMEEKRTIRDSIYYLQNRLCKLQLNYNDAINNWCSVGGSSDTAYLSSDVIKQKELLSAASITENQELAKFKHSLSMMKLNCEKTEESISNYKQLIYKKQKLITSLHESIHLAAVASRIHPLDSTIKLPVYGLGRIFLNIRKRTTIKQKTVYYSYFDGILRKSKKVTFDTSKQASPKEDYILRELVSVYTT
jgi:hypothetical protein